MVGVHPRYSRTLYQKDTLLHERAVVFQVNFFFDDIPPEQPFFNRRYTISSKTQCSYY